MGMGMTLWLQNNTDQDLGQEYATIPPSPSLKTATPYDYETPGKITLATFLPFLFEVLVLSYECSLCSRSLLQNPIYLLFLKQGAFVEFLVW